MNEVTDVQPTLQLLASATPLPPQPGPPTGNHRNPLRDWDSTWSEHCCRTFDSL